jgi:hypothetical protein
MITLVECFKYLQSNCNARLDETNKCAQRARPWEKNEKKSQPTEVSVCSQRERKTFWCDRVWLAFTMSARQAGNYY